MTGRISRSATRLGQSVAGVILALLAGNSTALGCKRIQSELEAFLAARGGTVHIEMGLTCPEPGDLIVRTLAAGGIVFLGEVHDNPLHHELRGQMLAWLKRSAPAVTPAFVFEHIRADQITALVPVPQTTDALFAALKWDESGWPEKAMFVPLFQQVIGRPILAGEPARGRVRDVARQGIAALPAEEAARFKLVEPLAPAQQDALLSELEASHCGLMPKSAFGSMALAQRYRDAFLAEAAMTAAASQGGSVVFTGNGHARRDRGAPFALKQRGFDKPVLVVLFNERAPERLDSGVADVIVTTAPAVRKDPCDEMRARFGKKG